VALTSVIEAWCTLELESHPPPHGQDAADHPLAVLSHATFADGHEVLHLADPAAGQEARDQHVRVREIELLGRPVPTVRLQAEVAAAHGIEDCGEHARRVEARAAVPVDRPFAAYQSNAVKVADDPVLGDREIAQARDVAKYAKRFIVLPQSLQ
jgi:hypothetical protein